MEAEMKAQIMKIVDKIMSDCVLINSKVSKLKTDVINGPEILAKLEKVKDMVEELSQMDLAVSESDAKTTKTSPAVSASAASVPSTKTFVPLTLTFGYEFYHDQEEEIDTLFDSFGLDESNDDGTLDYDTNEEGQEYSCSIHDICDYDSDTGICEY